MDEVKNPYACRDCDGTGEMECCSCHSEVECDCCNGSGLDDVKIDVQAYEKAEKEMFFARSERSWVWDDGETILGRCNDTKTLAYADFARNKESP